MRLWRAYSTGTHFTPSHDLTQSEKSSSDSLVFLRVCRVLHPRIRIDSLHTYDHEQREPRRCQALENPSPHI